MYSAMIHGGVADRLWAQKNRARQESWSWTSRSITRKIYVRWLSKSNQWRYGWIGETLVSNRCPASSLRYTQESVADSDLEDGQLRTNAYFIAVYTGTRKLWFFSKTCSFRETWRNRNTYERSKCTTNSSSSLQTRKLDVTFISKAESFRETCCNVFTQQWTNSEHVLSKKQKQRTGKPVREWRSFCFFFFNADQSNVGGSLLEGNKDHLLNQARSELVKQEHKVGSLNSCINELQQQAYAQSLELQDDHHRYIESRRENNLADLSSTGTSRRWKRVEEGTSGKKRSSHPVRGQCEIRCQRGSLAERWPGDSRAKKALRYLKGTRELNLFLTIPALKPNDLNKTLTHITGYSDADWADYPVTRKSTSCTLCCVDQFLLTSECRGQGTVALSSGESELYALGALSVELIFAHAILKEIGLSFLKHARADSSTARAVAAKQGASRKMKHIHTRFLFIQDLVFRKLLTMSSVKTDVNPSDIGTKALGRERFYRLRSMLGVGRELSETSSPGNWYDGNEWRRRVASRTDGEVDKSNDRHMWASVDFVEFSQCNEGRLANLTQPRDARRRACWTRVMLLHSWSYHTTVTFFSHSDVLSPTIAHTLEHVLCCFPLLHNWWILYS